MKYNEFLNSITKKVLIMAKLLNLKRNIQLRTNRGKAIGFEINPRFSSSMLFRHLLGFEDLQWSLDELVQNTISKNSKPKQGQRFYKGHP